MRRLTLAALLFSSNLFSFGYRDDVRVGDPKNRYFLVEDAKHGFREARLQAINECGAHKYIFCIRTLGDNLQDIDKDIRLFSARNLGIIGHRSAIQFLAIGLGQEGDMDVKAELIWALGHIRHEESAEVIRDFLLDPSERIRRVSAHCLAEMFSMESLESIKWAMENEKSDRVKVEQLKAILLLIPSDTKYRSMMIEMLKSRDRWVRLVAVESMVELKLKEGYRPLLDAIDHEEEQMVHGAMIAAEKIIRFLDR